MSAIKYSFALPKLIPTGSNHSNKSSISDSEAMPQGFAPTQDHVMCGRGKKCYEHNETFRTLVSTRLTEYSAAPSKPEKSRIVSSVFDEVNRRGGFVRQDSKTKVWYSVPEMTAREKISQAFRDCLTAQYKSSKDCRQKKRKQARDELRKSELQWDQAPATKRARPASPPTALKTSDALKQLLMFSKTIANRSSQQQENSNNNTYNNNSMPPLTGTSSSSSACTDIFQNSSPTNKKRSSTIIGMEVPIEIPAFHPVSLLPPSLNRFDSASSVASFGMFDSSEEFMPMSRVSA
ncbi:Nitrilase family, member 2 [Seminavis robusta]|uniref:Nitrilase family, member 2 n=1 Tax=Seminavis robusta TaxID=568900 RepID=A0A9N8DDQ2_9STRA|nr:Nitrilase family, member 2 [Seminavis robusta]|eukprot:Sro107_g053780.1 Nitrilase family, member 2 (292) ;mRNA; r:27886-28761